MDVGFATALFPSCTLNDLKTHVAKVATPDLRMIAEIARREAVAAGDMSRATAAERLRAVSSGR